MDTLWDSIGRGNYETFDYDGLYLCSVCRGYLPCITVYYAGLVLESYEASHDLLKIHNA